MEINSSSHVIKHRTDILPDGFLSMSVIGKSGCGKTRFLTSLIPLLSPEIKTIIIATVINEVPLHLCIVKYGQQKEIDTAIVTRPADLRRVVDVAREKRLVSENKQGLIIFDDFNTGSKTGPFWDCTIHAFTKLRNLFWNFIIVSQYPTFIPPIIRNNTNVQVLFNCHSQSAIVTFVRDIRNRLDEPFVMDTLIDYIRNVEYTYILVKERPFTVMAGQLEKAKPIITNHDTHIPNLLEIQRELGVKNRRELATKSAMLQVRAGNDASRLREILGDSNQK